MPDSSQPIARLLQQDPRYTIDAYAFIEDALYYAHEELGMGADSPTESAQSDQSQPVERHVTGQELCEAIRRFALEQYGYMAKTVLNSWGIHGTGDFGEIVFNLIRIGRMRKTPSDARVDFDNLYDFDTAFRQDFKITRPE